MSLLYSVKYTAQIIPSQTCFGLPRLWLNLIVLFWFIARFLLLISLGFSNMFDSRIVEYRHRLQKQIVTLNKCYFSDIITYYWYIEQSTTISSSSRYAPAARLCLFLESIFSFVSVISAKCNKENLFIYPFCIEKINKTFNNCLSLI